VGTQQPATGLQCEPHIPLHADCCSMLNRRREEPQTAGCFFDAVPVSDEVRTLGCTLRHEKKHPGGDFLLTRHEHLQHLLVCRFLALRCQLLNADTSRASEPYACSVMCCPAACTCSVHSSNFVMTAAAQNLLCLQLASGIGVVLDDPFKLWLVGGCVPAALGKSLQQPWVRDSSSTVEHCSWLQQCWLTENITRTSGVTVYAVPLLHNACTGWATPTSTHGSSRAHWLLLFHLQVWCSPLACCTGCGHPWCATHQKGRRPQLHAWRRWGPSAQMKRS